MDQRALLFAASIVLLMGIACAELAIDANAPAKPPCESQALDLSIANSTHAHEAGPALDPGWYEIWCGKMTWEAGGSPDIWMAYGPVELLGGVFYVFDVSTRDLFIRNPRKINFTLDNPKTSEAKIWFELDSESSYEVCFEGPYESKEEAKHKASITSLEEEVLFHLTSDAAVNDGPHSPTNLSLEKTSIITRIQTLHWNHGKGQKPGTIGLKDDSGNEYGPWQAIGTAGMGGVPNVYWIAVTDYLELAPGRYTVVDSDPSTWSYNRETKGRGIVWIYGQAI